MKPLPVCLALVFFLAPPLGWFAWEELRERQRLLALPPASLPGVVLMYTAPG